MTRASPITSERAPIILVAPSRESAVRIARYQDTAGETIIGNADFTPHAITDGQHMQAIGSQQEILSKSQVGRLLTIGKCTQCSSVIKATAGAVDAIDIAGTDVHCPMCTAMIKPDINYTDLSNALAAEVAAEMAGEDDDSDDSDDDVDDGTETYDDMDSDDAGDDGSDGDPEANNEDEDDDSEEDAAYRTVAEDEDDDSDEDDSDDSDDDDDEDDSDDDKPFGGDDDSNDDDDDDDVEQAAAQLRPMVARATRRRGSRETAMDVAPMRLPGISDMDNEEMVPMDELPMDGSDMGESDGGADNDGNLDDMDFDAAVAAVSRQVRGMGRRPQRRQATAHEDAEIAEAKLAVRKAERRLAKADDELQRTKNLNRDKLGGRRPAEVDTDSVSISPRLSGEHHDGDDMDDMDDITVGEAPVHTAAVRRRETANTQLIMARIQLECAMDGRVEQPIAGRPRQNTTVDAMHEGAKERIRTARGGRVDGNGALKSTRATAGVDDDMVDPLGLESPGMTSEVQPETPGTTDPTLPMSAMDGDIDGATPGTGFDEDLDPTLAALANVDWRRDRVELLSTASGAKCVLVNDRPIGVLQQTRATAGVRAQWDSPVLHKAFETACQKGLPVQEAKEFGMSTYRFRVTGTEAVRTAVRNANNNAQHRASREIARTEARLQQSLRTAFLGTMKGAFPQIQNPMRDRLITSLASLGVQDAKSVVDTAMAHGVDATLQGVFAKATELCTKPDLARNEVASYVAEASYQGRVDEGTILAQRLEEGNAAAMSTAASNTSKETAATVSSEPQSKVVNMRRHLERIARKA